MSGFKRLFVLVVTRIMNDGNWYASKTEVLAAIDAAIGNQQAVLTTVVGVEGSSYRRPGAKMVIDDGDSVGSITAGCIEKKSIEHAEEVLANGEPVIEQFDLRNNDNWGFGVGCDGVIDVLFEPLDASYQPIIDVCRSDDEIAVVTVLDGGETEFSCGDRAVAVPTGVDEKPLAFETDDWPESMVATVSGPAHSRLEADVSGSTTVDYDGNSLEIFIDVIASPPELIVFGSGPDVVPVTELASRVGFRVTVFTFRGGATENTRFPSADRVLSASPTDIRDHLAVDGDMYAVVMSHNFIDDRLVIDELLSTPTEYIGLLGPRNRFIEMRKKFAQEGRTFTKAELDRIYTPAGLNLGGGSPFQIAQSIVSEVTAIHHDRVPTHLTEQNGPIHDRLDAKSDKEGVEKS